MRTRIELRLPRTVPRPAWSFGVLLAAALTVEVLGRGTTSDLQDGLAVSVLGALVLTSYLVWGKRALRWTAPLRDLLENLVVVPLRARRFEIGIDLRESPPIPAGSPPLVRDLLVGLSSLAIVLLTLSLVGGVGYRAAAIKVLYLGHLASLATLWILLLLALATSVLVPFACIHDVFASRHVRLEPRARRNERLCVVGYFGLVLLGFALLPVWVPAALSGIAITVLLITLWRPSTPPVTLLWRLRTGGEARSLQWRVYETYCAVAVALIFVNVILLSLGGASFGLGEPDPAMPVTTTLGKWVAWLGGTALTSGALFATLWIHRQCGRDPSRPYPTSIWTRGSQGSGKQIAAVFHRLGWQSRFEPEKPRPEDVQIELTESMQPLPRTERRWPLPVSLKGLEVPELRQILARRDEIQRRRAVMRGLERLLKHAAKRNFSRGTGFWLAPHYWYISGMTRDVDEGQSDVGDGTVLSGIIGPSYHLVLSRSARHHLRDVLRSLEIDLIFVQDGVGFRGFRRVLRVLLEHYDMHGGRRRIEDRHFCGLPGIRTVVHDYELGNPLRKRGYPEPDYETLGRARVLHVFRDKGEEEQKVEEPIDVEGVPIGV